MHRFGKCARLDLFGRETAFLSALWFNSHRAPGAPWARRFPFPKLPRRLVLPARRNQKARTAASCSSLKTTRTRCSTRTFRPSFSTKAMMRNRSGYSTYVEDERCSRVSIHRHRELSSPQAHTTYFSTDTASDTRTVTPSDCDSRSNLRPPKVPSLFSFLQSESDPLPSPLKPKKTDQRNFLRGLGAVPHGE